VHAAELTTKHATALNRLSLDERQRECVGCHVTGADRLLDVDGKMTNGNVQCESCHGPERTYVEAAKSGGSGKGNIVRKPATQTCERCHNKKSPHVRGLFYDAMLGFVHRTK
jgi:Cytochrome c554 and c-prime